MNEVLSCCLYFTANKLSRVITKMAEEAFAKTGLSPMYGFLLLTVDENPGMSPTQLASELSIAPSTITRFVDKLEQKGFVERSFSGKFSNISLTEKGKALKVEINEAWSNLYKEYSAILGEEQGKAITANINKVADQLLGKQ